MEPGVNNPFLPDLFLRLPLFHQFVNVRHGDHYEALIILHPGNRHFDKVRFPVCNPAEDQFKPVVFLKGFPERLPVHSPGKGFLIFRMYIFPGLPRAGFKKILAAPRLGKHPVFFVGMEIDKLTRVHIDVIQINIAPGQGMGDMIVHRRTSS